MDFLSRIKFPSRYTPENVIDIFRRINFPPKYLSPGIKPGSLKNPIKRS